MVGYVGEAKKIITVQHWLNHEKSELINRVIFIRLNGELGYTCGNIITVIMCIHN